MLCMRLCFDLADGCLKSAHCVVGNRRHTDLLPDPRRCPPPLCVCPPQVLGGAGPAVASVPLTMLWAGGSAFSLLRSITTGSTGPVVALQQFFYVPLMTMSMVRLAAACRDCFFCQGKGGGSGEDQVSGACACCGVGWSMWAATAEHRPSLPCLPAHPTCLLPSQFVSGFSRMLAALLAAVPPYRDNGDDATVQRLIRRPNSALEAGARAPMELVLALAATGQGLLLDPIAVRRRLGLWRLFRAAAFSAACCVAAVNVCFCVRRRGCCYHAAGLAAARRRRPGAGRHQGEPAGPALPSRGRRPGGHQQAALLAGAGGAGA